MKRVGNFALLGLAAALAGCGTGKDAKKPKPQALVAAVSARADAFTPQLVALGTVTPLQSVAVRTRVDGQITAILFHEGDNVRAGQPLFRLDARTVAAQLAQDRAALAAARANAVQADADLGRAEQLVGKGFISKAVLDQKRAAALSGRAAISGAVAAIQSAEASLSYLTIRAPVSGRTGEIGFKVGAAIRAADTLPLVTINQLSPIAVRFLIPAEQIQPVRSAMAAGRVTVAAMARGDGGESPTGAATSAANSAGPSAPLATGRLAFLDNNVDPGNGSVAAKAEFNNVGDILWPGAIVSVELPLGTTSQRISLPESAVQTGRDTPFVWTVGSGGKIAMRPVTIAGRAHGKVYLASGVSPGESVVTDALAKLREGDTVKTHAIASPTATALSMVKPRA